MPDIAIIGEAYGAEEERQRVPFVGAAGWQLTQMLKEAGINRADCFLSNVFNLRPKANDIETLCCSKADDRSGLPPLRAGKYLQSQYLPELTRLLSELRGVNPNIIIALGNTAAWALLRNSGISKIRGTIAKSPVLNLKVLPTYHPAAILRQWELRHVTILDLMKAKRESAYPEIRRPQRSIWIEPSLRDLGDFYERYIERCQILAFDIETHGREITCIGFAPDRDIAIVVPFTDPRQANGSYWPSHEAEVEAWSFVRNVLRSPCRKLAQNGLFDVHFLWRQYGIAVENLAEDTMLLHHALQPESEKGLGFLGSVYTNEPAWKLMRTRGKTTLKRDE